jgi:hypothetical protein
MSHDDKWLEVFEDFLEDEKKSRFFIFNDTFFFMSFSCGAEQKNEIKNEISKLWKRERTKRSKLA